MICLSRFGCGYPKLSCSTECSTFLQPFRNILYKHLKSRDFLCVFLSCHIRVWENLHSETSLPTQSNVCLQTTWLWIESLCSRSTFSSVLKAFKKKIQFQKVKEIHNTTLAAVFLLGSTGELYRNHYLAERKYFVIDF